MAVSISSALLLLLSYTACHVSATQQRGISLQDRISNMEELMFNENLLLEPLIPCGSAGPANSGEQTAAEWVRIVFHDFVTANVIAGTGGLDASIAFESNRAENTGKVFINDTLDFFLTVTSPFASMSDVIAAGAVMALTTCSGFDPAVPLRVGRVDATEAGPTGVPEAFTDLNTTLAQFSRAGFNQSEAIMAVACGHSIGSVHEVNFPDIVSQTAVTPNNTDGADSFDSTPGVFDHVGVSEYLNGSGKCGGPLVVGFNATTRSDLRLFSSDNNATMENLNSPDAFKEQCANIFGRMMDTVPANVVLSDPIQIPAMKISGYDLELSNDGVLQIVGDIRLLCGAGQTCPQAPPTLTYTYTTDNGTTPEFTTGVGQPGKSLYHGNYTFYFFQNNITAGTRAMNVGSDFTLELETDIFTLSSSNRIFNSSTNTTTFSLSAAVLTSLLPSPSENCTMTTVHWIQVIPPCIFGRQSHIIEVEKSIPVSETAGAYTIFAGQVVFEGSVRGFVWQAGINGLWSERGSFDLTGRGNTVAACSR